MYYMAYLFIGYYAHDDKKVSVQKQRDTKYLDWCINTQDE